MRAFEASAGNPSQMDYDARLTHTYYSINCPHCAVREHAYQSGPLHFCDHSNILVQLKPYCLHHPQLQWYAKRAEEIMCAAVRGMRAFEHRDSRDLMNGQ